MNTITSSKYDLALARMEDLGFTNAQLDFIFADWPNEDEHYDWLLTASKEEIEDWGEYTDWGREDA